MIFQDSKKSKSKATKIAAAATISSSFCLSNDKATFDANKMKKNVKIAINNCSTEAITEANEDDISLESIELDELLNQQHSTSLPTPPPTTAATSSPPPTTTVSNDVNNSNNNNDDDVNWDSLTVMTVQSTQIRIDEDELKQCKLVRFGSVKIHCHPYIAGTVKQNNIPSSVMESNNSDAKSGNFRICIDENNVVSTRNSNNANEAPRRRSRAPKNPDAPYLALGWNPCKSLRFSSIEEYDAIRLPQRRPVKKLRITSAEKAVIFQELSQKNQLHRQRKQQQQQKKKKSCSNKDCGDNEDLSQEYISTDGNDSDYAGRVARNILQYCQNDTQQQTTIKILEEEGFNRIVTALQQSNHDKMATASTKGRSDRKSRSKSFKSTSGTNDNGTDEVQASANTEDTIERDDTNTRCTETSRRRSIPCEEATKEESAVTKKRMSFFGRFRKNRTNKNDVKNNDVSNRSSRTTSKSKNQTKDTEKAEKSKSAIKKTKAVAFMLLARGQVDRRKVAAIDPIDERRSSCPPQIQILY